MTPQKISAPNAVKQSRTDYHDYTRDALERQIDRVQTGLAEVRVLLELLMRQNTRFIE